MTEIFDKNRYNGQRGGCNVSVGRYKNCTECGLNLPRRQYSLSQMDRNFNFVNQNLKRGEHVGVFTVWKLCAVFDQELRSYYAAKPVWSVDFDVKFYRLLIDVVSLTPLLVGVSWPCNHLQVGTRVEFAIVRSTIGATLGGPALTSVGWGVWPVVYVRGSVAGRAVIVVDMTTWGSRATAKQVAYVARPASTRRRVTHLALSVCTRKTDKHLDCMLRLEVTTVCMKKIILTKQKHLNASLHFDF